MTTKHTQGKWVLTADEYNVKSETDIMLCVNSFEDYDEKCKANAKLIASAPDLLEALQLIFKHYDRNNGEAPHHCHGHKAHWDLDDSPCEVCSDWEKARAAINKAIQ